METLLSKLNGPELIYRYVLLGELLDDPEPLAASALMRALSDMGTTEQAIKQLPAEARLDPDYEYVLEGIDVLQGLIGSSIRRSEEAA